ncbi:globin family protein [uncultured Sphingomonas sp.]|uniref:globin family protein n=1 Tax=uncultured Sphingomonas sp. TaxID=158754 RepID=UPI002602FC60|nr:globin family protein [uncultured Sphingomonas sp.]
MITSRQITLVQNSFAAVLSITGEVAADFYARLFALAPDTRALFRHDMAEQGRKLFLTLATVVDSLDVIERVLPVAEDLAVRHVGYGAHDRHYAAVGEALVGALAATLGDRFDPDTRAGWIAAYSMLSDRMRAAAAGVGHGPIAAAA